MRKQIIILTGLILMAATTWSQDAEKAKQILNQVTAKTKTFTTIYAEFSFTLQNQQENISESYDGTIKIKGNKYKVSLMDVETFYDGKTMWTYMKEAGEVNVSTPDANDDSTLNPAKIFNMWEKGFKYQYVGEKTENGKTLFEIDLFPENRDKPFSRIKLFIYKDNYQIASFRQIGKDGNNYTIKVKKMVTDQAYADTDFAFNKAAYPKVDVIDMR
jgi:outer membrane lipoprotein-sorting protein